ncbi:HAMP domain-containing sensor histidine kinase [Stigmatella aurantiaca]|uniref:histidine kinase n=1 Tax=Stigmatella aurantiaca (strain DW4/3-1) TaxID=378806 RepID=Q08YL6_STIAD|nr:ATP-binding protein [Stigmatella aurantiaca]ADO73785.1 Sensor protein [Stigmatella aurantiaca DW4/3-1]EAU65548.1 two-component system sensor protein [Stigmatella aurantiaca DW4/3-1]
MRFHPPPDRWRGRRRAGPQGPPSGPFQGRSHRPWRMTRLGHYIRARLHRRIFVWFGLSILATGVMVATVMNLMGGSFWNQEMDRARRFASNRVAEVWDLPERREALVQGISQDLDVDLELRDSSGALLNRAGKPCTEPDFTMEVGREGAPLGSLHACYWRSRPRSPGRVLPLLITGVMLWILSGAIARRLTRPMDELVRAVSALGEGKLETRVQLGRAATSEMGVLAVAFNDMAARLERQMAEQRELLATVSHELRTPLAHLRVLTEILRDGGSTPKTLDQVDREVVELDALVGELLASSRLDFGQVTPRPLEGKELAARALERTGMPAELLSAETGDTALTGDATLLGRALANLLDNARKHAGAAVALRLTERGGQLAFCVEDQGPGLQPGEETRIFAPFYRKDLGGEAREAGSLGLGLALVQRIARAHGGEAFAENRPEGGARVGFTVSRAGPAAPRPPAPT